MNFIKLNIKWRPSKLTLFRASGRIHLEGRPCIWPIEARRRMHLIGPPSDISYKYPEYLGIMFHSFSLARRYNPFELNVMPASYLNRIGVFMSPYEAKLQYMGICKLALL